jgi:TRAP-type mannitol/chloroaromatic compound transport system permease large subunit
MFGMDGVEVGLIIVFFCLFAGILSGYPVAFAIGGAALLSFGILAMLSEAGWLTRELIDNRSDAFYALLDSGISEHAITLFRYPDLPTYTVPLFENGADGAFFRTLTFIVNRMNERVFAGPSIELLLAVAMFIMMGIALERSRIAQDLLTSMARVFGGLPGGLAVSVVVVGAFLAASTGIVGATVVTMGLLSLPTMLRHNYSPELATGIIAASGTLGQIIPPSIVIVLLGTLAGDLYATAQEQRAIAAGCRDALTYLGEAAVVSVGTLFKAAIVPGLMLAFLYALYVFVYAMLRPGKAPPIEVDDTTPQGQLGSIQQRLIWCLAAPVVVVAVAGTLIATGMAGPQVVDRFALIERQTAPELRTNVSEQCQVAMIELHGQDMWDRSVAAQLLVDADTSDVPGDAELDAMEQQAIDALPPISKGMLTAMILFAAVFAVARGVAPGEPSVPLLAGSVGILGTLLVDALLVSPRASPGTAALLYALPFALVLYGLRHALPRLAGVTLLRVVFPPLVLIIAVLGSILGGITSPTAAAGLGAAGALMLSAYRKLGEDDNARGSRFIVMATFSIVIFLLLGVNFDLRTSIEHVGFENWVAFLFAASAYHVAFAGLLYSCWVLLRGGILRPVVRDTAKVTSMVFAILIGSQMLNLVVISFGGEEYIQDFLRSFDNEWKVFLVVMLVLFVLGFVLDFLEIIYIVIPIVGPVIYGGTLDPKWVTIMIAVNLQTSFLTPPFGFALFYLRGVAPPGITTGQIYKGVIPFVLIQIAGLTLMWLAPEIVTFLPSLLPEN